MMMEQMKELKNRLFGTTFESTDRNAMFGIAIRYFITKNPDAEAVLLPTCRPTKGTPKSSAEGSLR